MKTAQGRGAILLATGGTGGHIFPALALAVTLQQRGWQPALAVDARFFRFAHAVALAGQHHIPVHQLASGGSGGGLAGKAKSLLALSKGTLQTARLLNRLRPKAVIGFGGYFSFLPILHGRAMGIPVFCHEQNAVLGRSNRWLSRFLSLLALSFPDTQGLPSGVPTQVTGNPVRAEIADVRALPYAIPEHSVRLLVLGGSLGARVFAQAVPEALLRLPPQLRARLTLAQQCREADRDALAHAYKEAGIPAETASFFTDVPERLATAHLIIARAGASTVCELMAAARPAILVPFPQAMDDHQTRNAQAMQAGGGAWLIPETEHTAEQLHRLLEQLLTTPALLSDAAARLAKNPLPDAATSLAEAIEARISA